MNQTYYGTLEIPSTATQAEIRAAYRRQLDRVHAGLLPASFEREIERAYTTLGNPSRRLTYDVDLASRPAAPLNGPAASQPLMLLAGMAAGAALTVALALSIVLPSHTMRRAPAPAHHNVHISATATARSQPAEQATATETPATTTAEADEPSSTPDAAAPPAAPAATAPALPVAAAPPPAIAARPAAPVSARRAPAYVPISAGSAYASPPEYAEPSPSDDSSADTSIDASAAPDSSQETEGVEAPPTVVAAPNPPAVLSSPYGGSRVALRVPGWYCSDASGGQVFVAAGSPLPDGVSCQQPASN
jgi:hypothetical protein